MKCINEYFLENLKYINENSFMHFILYGYLALISLSKVLRNLFYEIKYFPFDFKTWNAFVWKHLETISSRKTLFWEKPSKYNKKVLISCGFQQGQTITSTWFYFFDFPKLGKLWDVTDYHP